MEKAGWFALMELLPAQMKQFQCLNAQSVIAVMGHIHPNVVRRARLRMAVMRSDPFMQFVLPLLVSTVLPIVWGGAVGAALCFGLAKK